MTFLQQEYRICRAGKKAIPHKWKDYFAQREVDDAPVENMKPCLVQRRNWTIGLQPGSPGGSLFTSLSSRAAILSLQVLPFER